MIAKPDGQRGPLPLRPRVPAERSASSVCSRPPKVGSISTVEQIILYCYHYDPQGGKYVLVARRVMQVGGGAVAIVLFGFLGLFWARELRKKKRGDGQVAPSRTNASTERSSSDRDACEEAEVILFDRTRKSDELPAPARDGRHGRRRSTRAYNFIFWFSVVFTVVDHGRDAVLRREVQASQGREEPSPRATSDRSRSSGRSRRPSSSSSSSTPASARYIRNATAAEGATEIRVRAQEVELGVRVPDGRPRCRASSRSSSGRPYKMIISSDDVLHSFYIPEFRHEARRGARASTRSFSSRRPWSATRTSSAPSTAARATRACSRP